MKEKIRNLFLAFSDLALAFFFVWCVLSLITHGRFAWVSMANMFAFQIFLLLIPFALAGIFLRVRRIQIASLIVLILFFFMFGKYFIRKQKTVPSLPDVLKVMTYNMLSFTPEISVVTDVIREEDADIVFMQETNFAMADYLQKEMLDKYPYQIHDPSDIPVGMSVISKYPFEPIDYDLGESWVGTPIPLAVDWNGQTVHVLNFHMLPTGLGAIVDLGLVDKLSQSRERHANSINQFVGNYPVPAIVAGDANDVSLNNAYRMLVDSGLQDAWAEAGFGLGHTFPGNKSPGTSRLHVGGFYVPEWMIRIDYIFASQEWEVLSAHLARTDGYSDHRGVVAFLRLK